MNTIKINNKDIQYRLEPWYTLGTAYVNYIKKGLKQGKKFWFFYWKTDKNKAWKWQITRTYRDYVIEWIDKDY